MLKRTQVQYKLILAQSGICLYCGMPADVRDHAQPFIHHEWLERKGRVLVLACKECNAVLGASVQYNLRDRIVELKRRLAKRHRRLLAIPDWEPGEFAGMSLNLMAGILRKLAARDLVRARLAFDFDEWRALGEPEELLPWGE